MTAQLDIATAIRIAEDAAAGSACDAGGVLSVNRGALVEVVAALRDDLRSDLVFLCNLTAVDRETEIDVIYHLQSLDLNHMLQVTVATADREDPAVPSLTGVYHGAHLQEREVYDLFGVRFDGHPDLRRLFLWDGFPGYPLRKDFLQMPGRVRAGLPGFPHEGAQPENSRQSVNAWPVPGSVPQRPVHPNDPPPAETAVAAIDGDDGDDAGNGEAAAE